MKRQSTEGNTEWTNMLELSNRHLEAHFIKILQQVIINIPKTNKKIGRIGKKKKKKKKRKSQQGGKSYKEKENEKFRTEKYS